MHAIGWSNFSAFGFVISRLEIKGFSTSEVTVRKLELYVKKYGPEAGPRLYHTLQSQAAHAGVSARLRRKIDVLTGRGVAPPQPSEEMPLFPESGHAVEAEAAVPAGVA